MKDKIHIIFISLLFLIGISSSLLLIINGIDYYSLPIEERVFSIKHVLLKPSGLIGHGIGILGSVMMIIGVLTYMIRKRFRFFFRFGYLKNWLEFHIFLCTVGPILVLFHTAFKFGGIVVISFWSMVIVFLSGFVGRFIYIRIPRTIQGQELTAEELAATENDLIQKLKKQYSLSDKLLLQINGFYDHKKYLHLTLFTSIAALFGNYFYVKRELKILVVNLKNEGISDNNRIKSIVKIAKTKINLSKRIGTLRTMQKLFRYWHIFHLPFALSMFIIMVIHIVIAITFGYKWIY